MVQTGKKRSMRRCESGRMQTEQRDSSKYEGMKVTRMLQIAEQRGWATEEGRGQGKEYSTEYSTVHHLHSSPWQLPH